MTDAQIAKMIADAAVDAATAAAAPLLSRLSVLEKRMDEVDGGKPDFEGPAPLAVCLVANQDRIKPETIGEDRVSWDFGDPAGAYNRVDGPNAGHVYDIPGTYTITETISGVVRNWRVIVRKNDRKSVYLASDGDDKRDGSSEANRVKTMARAIELSREPNTQIRIKAGDTIVTDRTLELRDFGLLTKYGLGSDPTIAVEYAKQNSLAIVTGVGTNWGVERIIFRTLNPVANEQTSMPFAIQAGGKNGFTQYCTFDQVGYAINGNRQPAGMIVQNNFAPYADSIRGYFCYFEGSNWSVFGNVVPNSTREHIFRGTVDYCNIQFNKAQNIDRRPIDPATGKPVDKSDINKSVVNMQVGSMIWVAGNVFKSAPVSFGPLGGGDGNPLKKFAERTRGIVAERNTIVNSQFQLQHGAEYCTLRNNLIIEPYADRGVEVVGFDTSYKRGVANCVFKRNTCQSSGKIGEMFRIGAGTLKVTLADNLHAAPNLEYGNYETVSVFIAGDPSEITMSGNVWASPAKVNKTPGMPIAVAGKYLAVAEFHKIAPTDSVISGVKVSDTQSGLAGVEASANLV